jgi:hypothetical protein
MPLSEDYHTNLLVLTLLKTDPNQTVRRRPPEKTGLAGQLPSRYLNRENIHFSMIAPRIYPSTALPNYFMVKDDSWLTLSKL